ncbi:MAG: hypothetical protein JOS17DRAFT_727054 [Linnemannia elongata]|nr:MAG: hypothetical protein JOS17DRAFT_727054 [Linnemannia elongata]
MGCCGSKHIHQEEEEQERLLNSSNDALHYGPNRMAHASFGEQNQIRETESLQKIVERTAGNLIDIPSTFQVERLQQQEAQNRSNEYLNALNTVKLPEQTIRKLYSMTSVMASAGTDSQTNDVHETTTAAVPRERSSTSSGSSIKAPSVREVLAEKTVDPKTVGWMASAMGELHQATESIDVEDVGDLIVTLSPPAAK